MDQRPEYEMSDAFSRLQGLLRQLFQFESEELDFENKGFGRDVIELIRAKNDYKHDRGPSDLDETMGASEEVQGMLRRCMEALAFFADYPIRRVEASDTEHHRASHGDNLFLTPGGGDRVSLYPFIVPMTCPRCETEETYFVDAWDRKRNVARMKSFEHGHTATDSGVAGSLEEQGNNDTTKGF